METETREEEPQLQPSDECSQAQRIVAVLSQRAQTSSPAVVECSSFSLQAGRVRSVRLVHMRQFQIPERAATPLCSLSPHPPPATPRRLRHISDDAAIALALALALALGRSRCLSLYRSITLSHPHSPRSPDPSSITLRLVPALSAASIARLESDCNLCRCRRFLPVRIVGRGPWFLLLGSGSCFTYFLLPLHTATPDHLPLAVRFP
jgi:hypothetical protein